MADGDIDQHANASVPGARGLFFPPYLAGGEQGALWNPRLKAALLGLGLQHTRADIARAFLEGVFSKSSAVWRCSPRHTPIDAVMISGNLVHSATSTQMLADILQRTVGSVVDKSPAAIGAALLARPLAGVAAERDRPAASRRLTAPHEATARVYAALYRQYLARAAQCE